MTEPTGSPSATIATQSSPVVCRWQPLLSSSTKAALLRHRPESHERCGEITSPRSQGRTTPILWFAEAFNEIETIREQFHHAIDLVPTILDALGVKPPETMVGHVQSHFDGISMRYSFDAATQRPRDAFLLDDRLTQHLARRLQGRHHPPHPQRLEPVRSRHLAALPRQCRPLRAA
jgi:hypothetical protein